MVHERSTNQRVQSLVPKFVYGDHQLISTTKIYFKAFVFKTSDDVE